jgi:Carboxypeptidase regulatory-like domain/TonB-dependent Receptor Plug Domain
MTTRSTAFVLLGYLSGLGLASPAAAQRTTGAIIGTVQDPSGAVLPGVTASLRSVALPGSPSSTTTDTGRYQFLALPPGPYEITFSLSGFTTLTRSGIVVNVGATVEVNVTMTLSAVAENVTVVGESPVVNTTSAEVSGSLNREWLQAAPFGRSYYELLRQGPGVNVGTSTSPVAFDVFGSGVNDNIFQLDGADQSTTHAANTGPGVFPNPEILQEVEFLALGAPAEYGTFMGGVFNAVTRQGSNTFSGDASLFIQTQGLTDRNTTPAQDLGRPFTRDHFHDTSFQLGGPIQRNRLWFFASYSDYEDLFSQVGADPLFPGGNKIGRVFAKITYQPSLNHRLTASLNPTVRYDSVAAGSALIDPKSIQRSPSKGFTPAFTWNATLSPRTALEVRGNYFYYRLDGLPPEGEPEVKTRYRGLDTGTVTGGVVYVGRSQYEKTSVSAKVTHYADRFLGGSHDLRLGVQYQRGTADNNLFYNDIVYTLAGQPQNGYIQVKSEYGAQPDQAGVFIDDSFRPHRRLTIDAGIRYDHSHVGARAYPEYDRFQQPTGRDFPAVDNLVTWNTVSPRLGFNLKLDDEGRTVLKGHYGRYYQSAAIAAAFYRVLPSFSSRFSFSGRYDAIGEPIGLVPITTPSNRRMDGDADAARTDQFVVGLERQVAEAVGVSVHFVAKRGSQYLGWQDVGGSYEPAIYLDSLGTNASGQPIDVFRLVGPVSERFFILSDLDDLFSRYRGVSLGVNKRMSRGWQLTSSFTWSKSTGRLISSLQGPTSPQNTAPIFSSFGQNPNDFVNSEGLLVADRPVLFKTQFVGNLPWGITTAVSHQYLTGRAWGRTVRVDGLGLLTTIRAEELDGERRLDDLNLLDLRIEKQFALGGRVRIAAIGDILNVLNGNSFENVASTLGTSAVFGVPTTVQVPRRLMIGTRVRF